MSILEQLHDLRKFVDDLDKGLEEQGEDSGDLRQELLSLARFVGFTKSEADPFNVKFRRPDGQVMSLTQAAVSNKDEIAAIESRVSTVESVVGGERWENGSMIRTGLVRDMHNVYSYVGYSEDHWTSNLRQRFMNLANMVGVNSLSYGSYEQWPNSTAPSLADAIHGLRVDVD
jgi:hypothetical protein